MNKTEEIRSKNDTKNDMVHIGIHSTKYSEKLTAICGYVCTKVLGKHIPGRVRCPDCLFKMEQMGIL